MRPLRLTFVCAALAAVALLLTGCLGIGGGGGNGPSVAEITPADASLYADAVIKPEGKQKESIDGFLSTVLDTNDPGAELTKLIDEGLKQGATTPPAKGEKGAPAPAPVPEADYESDIKPWLGDVGGVFTIGSSQNPPTVVALDASDTTAGVDFIKTQSTNVQQRNYKGVAYQLDEKGQAFGAIDDFVAYGDEAAFKAAIDVSTGSMASLADSQQYKDAIADVPDDALGRAYIDAQGLLGEAAQGQGVPSSVSSDVIQGLGIKKSLVAFATAEDKNVAVDIGGLGNAGGAPPKLLGELPSDSFAAVGISDVSGKINSLIDAIEQIGIPGLSRDVIATGLQSQTGLDLDEDVLSWLGDAAFFLRGTDPAAIEGGLVFESKDDNAAARALDKLGQYVDSSGNGTVKPLQLGGGGNGFEVQTDQLPQPLNVVQRNGKVVIGYGDPATEQALNPTETLNDAAPFTTATGSLGTAGPAFYLSIPQALSLLAQDPRAATPGFERAKPYLDRLSFLTAGTSDTGIHIVLGAK